MINEADATNIYSAYLLEYTSALLSDKWAGGPFQNLTEAAKVAAALGIHDAKKQEPPKSKQALRDAVQKLLGPTPA